MKKSILYILSLVALLFAHSCNDDFLLENKKVVNVYELNSPLYVEPTDVFTEVSITLPDIKNKDFKVVQYPKIIHFENLNGHIDENGKLSLTIKVDDFPDNNNVGFHFLGIINLNISGYGMLAIQVGHLNIGQPHMIVDPTYQTSDNTYSYIDFGPSEESNFSVMAEYSGVLMYQIIDYPSWLVFSSENKAETDQVVILNPSESMKYVVSTDRANLKPGYYEGNIVFATNSTHQRQRTIRVSMLVRDKTTTLSIKPIEGKVTDCNFDEQNNLLYIATQDPNQVQIVNTETNTFRKIDLSYPATSVSVSENGSKIFAGQKNRLSVYDTGTLSLLDEINTSFMINDVIETDRFYYISNINDYVGNSASHLYRYDKSNKKFEHMSSLTGGSMFKPKNHNYLITTSPKSTSGINLINIEGDTPQLIKRWHQEIIKKLFPSDDNTFIIDMRGNIFYTPNQNTGDDLATMGHLKPFGAKNNNFDKDSFKWFDESSQGQTIWGIYYSSSSVNEHGFNYPQVLEWDSSTREILRNIKYSDYNTIIDGKSDNYPTLPHFIFVNKAADRIFLIKNILSEPWYPQYTAWHLETLDIE